MTIYFPIDYALKIHDKIIQISDGILGIRDNGLLESINAHVKNDEYYPTLVDKLTHIVYSLAMGHAFVDGNKRTAIALGGFFLEINGYGNRVGIFILEMENIIVWTVEKKISKNFLLQIINNLIYLGELSEESKLKLLNKIR